MKFLYILLFLSISYSSHALTEDPLSIIQRIINSGDGHSIQTAYKVNTVNEEYVLLRYLNLKPVIQKLYIKDGDFYDAIKTVNKTVYFKLVTKKTNKIYPSII